MSFVICDWFQFQFNTPRHCVHCTRGQGNVDVKQYTHKLPLPGSNTQSIQKVTNTEYKL